MGAYMNDILVLYCLCLIGAAAFLGLVDFVTRAKKPKSRTYFMRDAK
jgi:hypothetical protein